MFKAVKDSVQSRETQLAGLKSKCTKRPTIRIRNTSLPSRFERICFGVVGDLEDRRTKRAANRGRKVLKLHTRMSDVWNIIGWTCVEKMKSIKILKEK